MRFRRRPSPDALSDRRDGAWKIVHVDETSELGRERLAHPDKIGHRGCHDPLVSRPAKPPRIQPSQLLADFLVVLLGVFVALWADSWMGARADWQGERARLEALRSSVDAKLQEVRSSGSALDEDIDGLRGFLLEDASPARGPLTRRRAFSGAHRLSLEGERKLAVAGGVRCDQNPTPTDPYTPGRIRRQPA